MVLVLPVETCIAQAQVCLRKGRTLTPSAHLIPFSVSRTLCPGSSLHSSSRPAWDLGNIGVPPVWFSLYTVSPVASEALVRMGPGTSPHHLVSCLWPLTLWLLFHRCFSKSQPSLASSQTQTQVQVRAHRWCLEQGTRVSQLGRVLEYYVTLLHYPSLPRAPPSPPTSHQEHPWPLVTLHHPHPSPQPLLP